MILADTADWLGPQVRAIGLDAEKSYSLLAMDVDFPIEKEMRRAPLLLWAKTFGGRNTISPEEGDLMGYIPPHPARGSDTHRILIVLLEHDITLKLPLKTAAGLAPLYDQRIIELRRLLSRSEVKLFGYNFFRSCWTAQTSPLWTDVLKVPEPIYGELLPEKPKPVSKYLYN